MTAPAPANFAVYSGLKHVGDLEKRASGVWKALDAEGRIIGEFPDRASAFAAALNKARNEPQKG